MATQDTDNDAALPGGAPLEQLLVSKERSTVKVKALVHATRAGDPASAAAVRKHIATETNPFVLATMASVLGRAGSAGDADLLTPLLDHADARVVANALQALYLQRVDIAPDRLAELAKRDDTRVRANALAILGRYNPEFVMERIASLSESPDAVTRAGIAYLLGEMPGHAPVLKRLFRMLEVEERTGVIKQLAQSVTKHAVPERAEAVIGALHEMKRRVTGGKVALVAMLLQEVGVELGMVETEVTAVGERHIAAVAAAAPKPVVPQSTPRAPLLKPPVTFEPVVAARIAPVSAAPAPVTEPEPVPAPVDGDVDINAHDIWGSAPTPPPITSPQSRSPLTTGGRRRPADLTSPFSPPAVAPPPRAKWPFAAAALVLLGAGVLLAPASALPESSLPRSSQVRATPAPPRRKLELPARAIAIAADASRVASASSARGAAADTAALWAEPGVIERLGPVGAPVDLEGTVTAVSPGRAVVRCLGRYYVVRGRELDRRAVGAKMRCRGKISGIAMNGLIYVDTEAT